MRRKIARHFEIISHKIDNDVSQETGSHIYFKIQSYYCHHPIIFHCVWCIFFSFPFSPLFLTNPKKIEWKFFVVQNFYFGERANSMLAKSRLNESENVPLKSFSHFCIFSLGWKILKFFFCYSQVPCWDFLDDFFISMKGDFAHVISSGRGKKFRWFLTLFLRTYQKYWIHF